jgi:hypothetical protein
MWLTQKSKLPLPRQAPTSKKLKWLAERSEVPFMIFVLRQRLFDTLYQITVASNPTPKILQEFLLKRSAGKALAEFSDNLCTQGAQAQKA